MSVDRQTDGQVVNNKEEHIMLKKILVKGLIVALGAIAPTATTYTSNGVYYADSQTVVDADGEEWGFDSELEDGTPVVIIFDSKDTDSRYDDVVISLTPVEQ